MKEGRPAKRRAWRTIVSFTASFSRDFLLHSAIAVEASGSYSWLVDEMERSGHRPKLCNPIEAKRRMALTKKNDKLDARGLAIFAPKWHSP